MKLRHRPMQPADIGECVDIVGNHPVIGPRYGATIAHLPEAWLRVLQCDALNTAIVHAGEGSRAHICFFGVSAIVGDDFLREMKRPPHFWLGPELTRRIMRGESPLLTSKQVCEQNSRDGLNLVCWESGFRLEYERNGEVQRYMMSGFIQVHRGYFWKEVISSQSWNAEHLEFVLRTGGHLWDPLTCGYTSTLRKDPSEIVSKPHIVGTTRGLELERQGKWAGSWVGALFDYHPPMLGLSRSEQRLLSCALSGATDEHLAETLGKSLPAVKKTWVSIYRRAEGCLPELISDPVRSDLPASGRGKEKRRGVLAYLREHPEELRPVSRASRESRTKRKASPHNTRTG
jgi:hypothetical protein